MMEMALTKSVKPRKTQDENGCRACDRTRSILGVQKNRRDAVLASSVPFSYCTTSRAAVGCLFLHSSKNKVVLPTSGGCRAPDNTMSGGEDNSKTSKPIVDGHCSPAKEQGERCFLKLTISENCQNYTTLPARFILTKHPSKFMPHLVLQSFLEL